MGILLALGAAAAYGVSDFVGGVASRRTSAWPVAFLASIGGLLGSAAVALVVTGDPTTGHLLWGALSGVGAGFGSAFLYRGFATGRMGVVAPVSAVGAAVLPVVVGFALGERPAGLVWVGLLLALPAIWLVAQAPSDGTATAGLAEGLLDGVLAGAGFGLLFVAIGQVPDDAGYWPLAVAQGTGTIMIVVVAVAMRVAWRPTQATEGWGLVAGLLASAAQLLFLLSTQAGLLTVAAVLTSLYPAFTILLAAVVLKEAIFRHQAVGLVLAGVSVALVAAG
ncbi:drug/metabolite transporter (DMT)-like permease [Nocardioides thalensis]|uniref:Drug/metabolite transporter (DMT)-like permease n=1 Tax=Nocardioides thalensis TaxID=1914755 RepID=A0A853C2H8_9ACTN|nr:EamA family transporter [Nocardioides thalensis]NYJ01835.1 drug/metabolite transporter (DMT)-like permease [Nocardioides thalensis]